jgi:hypothetical protein
VLQLQKDLKMFTDNVAVNVAQLKESTERMKESTEGIANRYSRMEIVLTEVEDALKEEEEQPQHDEVPKLEAASATDVHSDVLLKEIVEVSSQKALQIGELQLEENTCVKEDIKVPEESREKNPVVDEQKIYQQTESDSVWLNKLRDQVKHPRILSIVYQERKKSRKPGEEEIDHGGGLHWWKPIVTRVTDYHPLGDELYLESNDLSNPLEVDPAGFDMLDENLIFFNADDDNLQYMCFDPSEIMGTGNSVPDQPPLIQKLENEVINQVSMEGLHLAEEQLMMNDGFCRIQWTASFVRVCPISEEDKKGHERSVKGMACHLSGGLLATAGTDRKVLIWNADGGFCAQFFKSHAGVVSCIMFHPDPTKSPLFCGSDDAMVRVWNFLHKKCVANFIFLTLWARSSEEWEYVMGMIVMSFVQKMCVEDVAVARLVQDRQ